MPWNTQLSLIVLPAEIIESCQCLHRLPDIQRWCDYRGDDCKYIHLQRETDKMGIPESRADYSIIAIAQSLKEKNR